MKFNEFLQKLQSLKGNILNEDNPYIVIWDGDENGGFTRGIKDIRLEDGNLIVQLKEYPE